MSLRNALNGLTLQLDRFEAGERYAAAAKIIIDEGKKRPLKVGDRAPAFSLWDSQIGHVASSEFLQRGPLVVNFYRGLWCPYCQLDLASLQQITADFSLVKTSLIAITHDVDQSVRQRFLQAHPISFPLLDDSDGNVAEQFGIRWSSEDSQLIETELGMNIVTLRGDGPWILPMQARYVIGPDSLIALTDVIFSYDERSEPSAILPILAELSKATPNASGAVRGGHLPKS
jgi:peroxiredoxin